MVNIKLLQIQIKNFKGTEKLDLFLGGKDIDISGRNGIGKTTIFDALCWLFTGKDSKGNQPESDGFQIKPRQPDGTVKSGVMPTVIAVFDVGTDRQLKLEKIFKEKWEKKRGQANPVFSGHTTEYYIDDIPRKESEFKNILSSFVGENEFRILTDVYRFPMSLKWQDRRQILFDLCNIKKENELMAQNEKFTPLLTAVGQWSVDEYKQGLKRQRRKINQVIEILPARIDEVTNFISDFKDIDFDALQQKANEQEKIIENLKTKIVEIDNNNATVSIKNNIENLKNQLAKLENENIMHRLSQQVPYEDKRGEIKRNLDILTEQLKYKQDMINEIRKKIEKDNYILQSYRESWKEIAKEEFTGNTICPTCKQAFPVEKIEQIIEHFNNDKKARQNRLVADSEIIKNSLIESEVLLKKHKEFIKELNKEIQETKTFLDNTPCEQLQEIEDLPNYCDDVERLNAEILKLKDDLTLINKDVEKHKQDINIELLEAKNSYNSLLLQLAKKAEIVKANARIDEIYIEQRTLSAELDNIDSMLALCDDFTKYKVDTITEKVNSKFKITTFRLFREQINGNIEDCCDVMLNGKPYGTISDGEKIKVGIDIIETISNNIDIKLPLFVDCAESVTNFPKTDLQTIKLIVKDCDMEVKD